MKAVFGWNKPLQVSIVSKYVFCGNHCSKMQISSLCSTKWLYKYDEEYLRPLVISAVQSFNGWEKNRPWMIKTRPLAPRIQIAQMEFVETNELLKRPNFSNTGAIFFNFTVTTAAGDESPASFSSSLSLTYTHIHAHTPESRPLGSATSWVCPLRSLLKRWFSLICSPWSSTITLIFSSFPSSSPLCPVATITLLIARIPLSCQLHILVSSFLIYKTH